MPKLHDIPIITSKRYIIVSKSPSFLNDASITIESMLNISDVYDTKFKKNTMTFNTIIFKDGGFIKFSLYNVDVLKACNYDILLIDRNLFASEYTSIHTYCIMADIKCIELDNDILDSILNDVLPEYRPVKVLNREYDSKFNLDYGNCPKCGTLVRTTDSACPKCSVKFNWSLDKSVILNRLKKASENNEESDDSVYKNIISVFGYDACINMEEKELKDLVMLASFFVDKFAY